MSTLAYENEMSTKIHIVFVSTVGLHPTSGNWRHRADRGSHITQRELPAFCVCT